MSEEFSIYVDRLRNGGSQKISGVFSPSFIDVDEPDLRFTDPVSIQGSAYLADDELLLCFSASTTAQMTCCICNKTVKQTIAVKDFYHTVALTEMRDALFDFRSIVRETLLIELPKVVECNGNCPEREAIRPYLHSKPKVDVSAHYYPFNGL
jgi:uncharacterized metal-binding protein YceD (DUF177 family)